MKYTPPISTWAPGQRITIQRAYQRWLKPTTMLKKYRSLRDWRYERELCRPLNNNFGKLHRNAVGMVRAFGSPTFFRGAYIGAENE